MIIQANVNIEFIQSIQTFMIVESIHNILIVPNNLTIQFTGNGMGENGRVNLV